MSNKLNQTSDPNRYIDPKTAFFYIALLTLLIHAIESYF
jgi:hypothetical protein